METWKQQGIPLHVVLRGVEKSFDSYEARPRKRTVKSLLYCQEEVEAQFAEWVEARVGSSRASENETDSDKTPFSFAAISEHLKRNRTALSELATSRRRHGEDDLSEALERAATLLSAIESDLTSGALETRKLEDSLTGLERMLNDAIVSVVSADALTQLKTEVTDQLKPYRSQMETVVYKQTFDNLLLKRLRELFAIPRLSLFYV